MNSSIIKPTVAIPSIMEIAPYVPGASKAYEGVIPVKLSSNENPFGPSPRAREAVQRAAMNMHRYPAGDSRELRAVIAETNNISADQIICGAGSDELIALICQAYAGIGDEVIYTKHGFLMYPISALRSGARPVEANEINLKADVDEILAVLTHKTRIIFLASPNNPTGSYLPRNELIRLLNNIPANVLLVIDAAYAEYAVHADYESGMSLVNHHPNLVVTRTFSKIYGLGGLRIGWSYSSPEIADILNRVRGPFNVSSLAHAGGIAALRDTAFLDNSIRHNTQEKIRMAGEISGLGIKVYPSEANFLLLDFAGIKGKSAPEMDDIMKQNGLILRRMEAYKLPTCLRLTIGKTEDNERVIEILRR